MCLGIPGKIIEITDADNCIAKVDVSGIKREVNLACVIDDEHPDIVDRHDGKRDVAPSFGDLKRNIDLEGRSITDFADDISY